MSDLRFSLGLEIKMKIVNFVFIAVYVDRVKGSEFNSCTHECGKQVHHKRHS